MIDLTKLESLSKIKLTDEEKTETQKYFEYWIPKFDMLVDIETENVEPLITVSSLENVMREDESYKMISREALLEHAPEQRDGYFVAPRILE